MSANYTLYYWPLPFRGHPIRYVLAHVGAEWRESDMEAVIELTNSPVAAQPLPFMAPPLLCDHAEGICIAQMPAILTYLGEKYGLIPEGPAGRALTAKILGDTNDVLEELTCNCGARMWTQTDWDDFVAKRLPRWMQIFEETGRRQGLGLERGHLLGTEEPSLADLVTVALWHTAGERFPTLAELLQSHAPAVSALCHRIAERPTIAAMRAETDRQFGTSWCGGEIEKSLRAVLRVT